MTPAGNVAMRRCVVCGLQLAGTSEICPQHGERYPAGDGWAVANRLMCDFVHRGIAVEPGVTSPWDEYEVAEDYETIAG